MTALEKIEAMTIDFLTPQHVATVLCCDPNKVRMQARLNPSALGFPVTVMGSRVRIPRLPFIRYIREGGAQTEAIVKKDGERLSFLCQTAQEAVEAVCRELTGGLSEVHVSIRAAKKGDAAP